MYSNKSIGIILSHVVILLFLTDEKAEVAVAILPHLSKVPWTPTVKLPSPLKSKSSAWFMVVCWTQH